jgi:hypothetical protein
VTMSAPLTEATYHAGVAITRPRGIVRLGGVVSYVPNPVGHTGVVLVATMEYDEVVRAYTSTGSFLATISVARRRGVVCQPCHRRVERHRLRSYAPRVCGSPSTGAMARQQGRDGHDP